MYRTVFNLGLRRLDPERAHDLAFGVLDPLTARPRPRAWLRRLTTPDDELIRVSALGLTFPSPLGVAAGLDKNAQHFQALGALGFGHVEVGTVTPQPQEPNPRPIIARLPADRALLNRMGFPNDGVAAVSRRLARRSGETIVGVNIGKNRGTDVEAAQSDYREAARIAAAADYLVVNVSSPNTPGLRALQAGESLRPLLQGIREELARSPDTAGKPLLVKIAPDLGDDELDAVADLALELDLAGIVATNTTLRRDGLRTPPEKVARVAWPEGGGVSGAPLKQRSLEVLVRLAARTDGRLTLISVGGIESADDVWERILAGASLVQAYTGFIYGGPGWPRRINFELARRVWETGAGSIQELVGTGHRRPATAHTQ
ncbi:MAG TPA: quinone-dependent dihydroorotate dehydrogenase [Solirubrobacteraceae bacterium]|nr:quinone-dependent dihydroorotate dehydrogenase [Solirubrobacteraceae bacterium]